VLGNTISIKLPSIVYKFSDPHNPHSFWQEIDISCNAVVRIGKETIWKTRFFFLTEGISVTNSAF